MHSQTLSKNQRIKAVVTTKGDTLLQMNISDARKLLKIVLEKEVNDNLLAYYIKRDSLNQDLITIKDEKIKSLIITNYNLQLINENLNKVIANHEANAKELRDVIKKQNKEIRKQKVLKTIGFIGCVVLPLLTIIYGLAN
jgi:hypothetical protein